jgi:ParB-like chromosome segregation protein Spo0J
MGKTDKKPQTAKSEKTEKPKQTGKPPKDVKGDKKAANVGGGGIGGTGGKSGQTSAKEETPPQNVAPVPEPPRDANRINEKEEIVYLDHSEIHPFKNHPFQVRDDEAMKTLVESVKERGVDQAALVRPREGGGYEMVAGHRRQAASIAAGIKNLPCIVRKMTDEEAVLAMTESNFNQRSEILASERAQALKMQLNAIKRQGERFKGVAAGDVGKRSNEIVAERNQMSVKTVQRYIALNNLVPDMMNLVDDKKVSFMAALEISYIKPKNQGYIAMNIESQQSAPTSGQAQRMRELDNKNALNADVIDGIMLEEKKEEIKVIISGQELAKYFGEEKTPKEMKDTILKLLDEYKAKQPPELDKPGKKKDAPEK